MRLSLALHTAAFVAALLPATARASSAITVTEPLSRATPAGAPTGVGYMTITNAGDDADRLVSASSPAVDHVEIHEMAVKNGIMTMRPVPGGLPIPPHGSVVLKSGGYHLMMIHPKQPFKAGEVIPVTLTFEKAGAERVDLSVLPLGQVSPTTAR
jgi:hypothetical protein